MAGRTQPDEHLTAARRKVAAAALLAALVGGGFPGGAAPGGGPHPDAPVVRPDGRFYRVYADGPLTAGDYAGTRADDEAEFFNAQLQHAFLYRRGPAGAGVELAMTAGTVAPVMLRTKSYLPLGPKAMQMAALHQLEFDLLDVAAREATAKLASLGDPAPQVTVRAATLAEAEQALGEAVGRHVAPFSEGALRRRKELRDDVQKRGQAALDEWRTRLDAERAAGSPK